MLLAGSYVDHVKLGTGVISAEDGSCGSNRAARVSAWLARAGRECDRCFSILDFSEQCRPELGDFGDAWKTGASDQCAVYFQLWMFPIFDSFFQGRHRIIPRGRRLLESSPHTLPSQQSTAGPCTSTEQSPLQINMPRTISRVRPSGRPMIRWSMRWCWDASPTKSALCPATVATIKRAGWYGRGAARRCSTPGLRQLALLQDTRLRRQFLGQLGNRSKSVFGNQHRDC
jgi:hypothetical protein